MGELSSGDGSLSMAPLSRDVSVEAGPLSSGIDAADFSSVRPSSSCKSAVSSRMAFMSKDGPPRVVLCADPETGPPTPFGAFFFFFRDLNKPNMRYSFSNYGSTTA
jgi:hypothetical protein